MKFLVLALFVAAAVAAPAPEDGQAVEMVVNGVAAGEPLEIGDLVDITMKKHVDGEMASATNLLHPLTAVGIAEAAAAAEAALVPEPVLLPEAALPEVVESIPEAVVLPEAPTPEVVSIPEAVVLPEAPTPEVVSIPEAVVLPEAPTPEVVESIPEAVVLPEVPTPEVVESVPEPIVLPSPAVPEVVAQPEPVSVVEESEAIPTPVAQLPNGEIYNDGLVQVSVNTPEDPGMMSTLQNWFNMVLNYFNNGAQTSQQFF